MDKSSEIKNLIERYNKLNEEDQNKVIESISKTISKIESNNLKKKIEEECKNNGHDYTEWERIEYSKYEKNPYLGNRDYMVPKGREYISVNYVKWERTCKRCGFVETAHKEPQELIDKREEVNKQKEIKRLEKMLKKLKGN